MRKLVITITFIVLNLIGLSQSDSVKIFAFDDFIRIVKLNHPLAIQAELQVQKGEAYLQKSKGLFDPQIYYNLQQKYYNDQQYFSLLDGGIRIPTWFGIELKSGISQNNGYYLNPQNSNPTGGLLYAGVTVPLGKRLFIDERRSELKKAQIYVNITDSDRKIMLNNLMYSAGKAYWDWFKAYNTLNVYDDAYQLANQRFKAVKQSADLGDRPHIDTLEAGIQVQNRLLNLQQAQLDFINTKAMVEIYLWAEGLIPLEMENNTVPFHKGEISEIANDFSIDLDTISNNHPKLQQYQFQMQQLEIQQKWVKEQLKPKLDLNYQPITSVVGGISEYSLSNYKWGVSFNMPIFLRKERAQLELTNLNMKETGLKALQTKASVNYEVKAALNEWNTTNDQVRLYENTVKDYKRLLQGERQLFSIGESSLFMVNSRELSYINAQLKLIELITKNNQSELKMKYAMGSLWES